MRSFDTESLTDTPVKRMLQGLNPLSVELAQDADKLRRLTKFHNYVVNAERVSIEGDEGPIVFEQPCFSALSIDGRLLGAKHRASSTRGDLSTSAYAFVEGSTSDDAIGSWRTVPWQRLEPEGLELTIEGDSITPHLSIVGETLNDYERACQEIQLQQEEEHHCQATTRVLLGRQAWRLLRPGYVNEPLYGTFGLVDSVARAQFRGFAPQLNDERQHLMSQAIDI